MAQTPISRLRVVGLAEAVSFLLLLGVAMPLKYLAAMPMAVKVVGWAHGLLFLGFCYFLLEAKTAARWTLAQAAIYFAAALIPFGPFVVDGRLRRADRVLRQQGDSAGSV